MNKISKLSDKSRNGEVNAVSQRISAAFAESALKADPFLTPIFGEINSQITELTKAINRMVSESDLELKDESRDQKYKATYNFVFGLTYSANAATQAAAKQVFAVLDHYSLSVTEENYDNETSLLDSLLLDLAAPELASAIAALDGLATLIAELQVAQDEFEVARLAYQKERGSEKQLLNATELKRQLVKLVNTKLIAVLNGLLISDPATYGGLATTLQEAISVNNETVKKRAQESAESNETA